MRVKCPLFRLDSLCVCVCKVFLPCLRPHPCWCLWRSSTSIPTLNIVRVYRRRWGHTERGRIYRKGCGTYTREVVVAPGIVHIKQSSLDVSTLYTLCPYISSFVVPYVYDSTLTASLVRVESTWGLDGQAVRLFSPRPTDHMGRLCVVYVSVCAHSSNRFIFGFDITHTQPAPLSLSLSLSLSPVFSYIRVASRG